MLHTKFGIANLVELATLASRLFEKWIAFRNRDVLNSNPDGIEILTIFLSINCYLYTVSS